MRKKHTGASKQIFTVHSFYGACITPVSVRTATTNGRCVSGVLDPEGWTSNIC